MGRLRERSGNVILQPLLDFVTTYSVLRDACDRLRSAGLSCWHEKVENETNL
jgi:hypothetical protein